MSDLKDAIPVLLGKAYYFLLRHLELSVMKNSRADWFSELSPWTFSRRKTVFLTFSNGNKCGRKTMGRVRLHCLKLIDNNIQTESTYSQHNSELIHLFQIWLYFLKLTRHKRRLRRKHRRKLNRKHTNASFTVKTAETQAEEQGSKFFLFFSLYRVRCHLTYSSYAFACA